ncbi:hypothetical protein BF49_0533 [Bradyrhizobium sp.]|nr:hypothetical protein BF49_0533 [Bradyrhizobium sp.]
MVRLEKHRLDGPYGLRRLGLLLATGKRERTCKRGRHNDCAARHEGSPS